MEKINNMLPKISILGDSLSLPRPSDGVNIDDTYPILLANSGKYIVINNSVVSADTDYFLESQQLHYLIKYANSEYFIIHLGICDCSPRIFTKKEKLFLNALSQFPLIKNEVDKYVHEKSLNRLHHTQERQISNVTQDRFRDNILRLISEIKANNPVKKIIIVNIIYPGDGLAQKSYLIRELVEQYNQILYSITCEEKAIELIDLHKFTKNHTETILPDDHHFNSEGHKFIFNAIKRILK